MKIPPFKLERFFTRYEFAAPYLMCCSDCESMSVGDLVAMEPDASAALEQLWLGYTESQGDLRLRERIAALYEHIETDHILVYTGGEEPIFSVMNVLLNRGDHVIVHYPCYQSLWEIAGAIGCDVTPWKTSHESNWTLDLDTLRKHIRPTTKLVVINCPHNPTGYTMPKGEFQELVALSQKHGFIIFSDEVYRFLEYREEDRLPALCEIDDRGISLGVMSKSFGLAGLRIGWIATRNIPVLNELAAFKDYTTICNSAPGEFLATIALKHVNRIIVRNREIIRKNLSLLYDFFDDYAHRFSWIPPTAGPIAFPRLMDGNIETFCRDLVERAGVLLLPGTVYDPGSNHFRIGFGRLNMQKCLQRFRTYLDHDYNRGSG